MTFSKDRYCMYWKLLQLLQFTRSHFEKLHDILVTNGLQFLKTIKSPVVPRTASIK